MKISPSSNAPDANSVLLESDIPLSQSVIWKMQREFYERRGLKAWTEDQVPEFITNNPFIAEIYARIVLRFLCDCIELTKVEKEPLSGANPLWILELGAGSGKFCYLFLKKLRALLEEKKLPLQLIRYVLTDCSEHVLDSWRSNAHLGEFVQLGVLDFEVPSTRDGFGVRSSGIPPKPPAGQMPNSLVVIANYVFDSLPQDAFVMEDGKISEALVTSSSLKGQESNTIGDLVHLQLSFKNAPVIADRYHDATWNSILEYYRTHLSSATVLFPTQALQILQQLGDSCNGRMLLLAADKGFHREETLSFSQGQPVLEFHTPNCFSQMVNFDAIARYFKSVGGEALLPEKHFSNLSICAFLFRRTGDRFPGTKEAYRQALAGAGPDDLFTLLSWLNTHMEEMTASQVLALLRLTYWDPMAFLRLFPVLGRQVRAVSTERRDLRDAVMRVWGNFFPVRPTDNVLPFQCGVILLELGFFEDARSMLEAAQKALGPTAAISYNLGLCSQGLGDSTEALAFMREACELDPSLEPARIMRQKLESSAQQE